MKRILILGAGRSSSALISYLLDHAVTYDWHITVGNISVENLTDPRFGGTHGKIVRFDSRDELTAQQLIEATDVVVSMLPYAFHPQIARWCLAHGKHLFTASYVSDAMQALHEEAYSRGLLLMNECGLDPGIDHMMVMQIIDRIHADGGRIKSLESFTGGLIAPDTDPENPWRYKFTWSPAGVVKAGQGMAKWLHRGKAKYLPYGRLFSELTEVDLGKPWGKFAGYANRDSIKYRHLYKLEGVQQLIRGTLRYPNFCAAWNVLVQLGCTDDTYLLSDIDQLTHRDFIASFLPPFDGDDVAQALTRVMRLDPNSETMRCLSWSGFFEQEPIGLNVGTPAQALEHILKKRWTLGPHDLDMAVMWHRCVYLTERGEQRTITSQIAYLGESNGHTAMAKGVGLPLAMALELLLTDKLPADFRGVQIPLSSALYTPILKNLASFGIIVQEAEVDS